MTGKFRATLGLTRSASLLRINYEREIHRQRAPGGTRRPARTSSPARAAFRLPSLPQQLALCQRLSAGCLGTADFLEVVSRRVESPAAVVSLRLVVSFPPIASRAPVVSLPPGVSLAAPPEFTLSRAPRLVSLAAAWLSDATRPVVSEAGACASAWGGSMMRISRSKRVARSVDLRCITALRFVPSATRLSGLKIADAATGCPRGEKPKGGSEEPPFVSAEKFAISRAASRST